MSENKTEPPQENNPAETPNTETGEEQAQAEATPEQLIEALMGENADIKDKLLRTMAEMENLRRRTEREKTDASKYAITSLAKDLLGIGDNLKRALDSVPADMRDAQADEAKNLIEGVELTEREFQNILSRHQINKIDAKEQKFNPNFHQAMFEVPNADIPSGTVLEVVQDGYIIGERVLRPAMVGVSKGGPKSAPNAEAMEAAAAAKKAADQLEETAQKQADAKTDHNVDKSA